MIGRSVALAVAIRVGLFVRGLVGVTAIIVVGSGVNVGGSTKLGLGVTSFIYDLPLKLGVMVGTGVSRLIATAVDRFAISADNGSRSSKTSLIRSRFTF